MGKESKSKIKKNVKYDIKVDGVEQESKMNLFEVAEYIDASIEESKLNSDNIVRVLALFRGENNSIQGVIHAKSGSLLLEQVRRHSDKLKFILIELSKESEVS